MSMSTSMSTQRVFGKSQIDHLGTSIRGSGLRISGYASWRLNRRAVSDAVSRLACGPDLGCMYHAHASFWNPPQETLDTWCEKLHFPTGFR